MCAHARATRLRRASGLSLLQARRIAMAKRVSKDQVRACVPRLRAGVHVPAWHTSVRACACVRLRSSGRAGRHACVRCAGGLPRACLFGWSASAHPLRASWRIGRASVPTLWRNFWAAAMPVRAYLDGPTRLPSRAGGLGTGSLTATAKVPASPAPRRYHDAHARADTHTQKSMMARPMRRVALARHCRTSRAAHRYLHDLRALLLARATASTSGCAHAHPSRPMLRAPPLRVRG